MIVLEESQHLDDCGGIMAPIKPAPFVYSYGDEFTIRLMSDLHIGAAWVDYGALKRELEDAKQRGSRILINGDVFDAILTKDAKRFSPQVLHSAIVGRDDVLNASLDMAEGLLAPYVDLIDMIGVGNHETAVEKYHSLDLVRLLIDRLQRHITVEGHVIHYGGYNGSVCYPFWHTSEQKASAFLDINYFHGSGGASPVTKGVIDFHRRSAWLEGYDVHWFGHKHNRLAVMTTTMKLNASRTAHVMREVRHIQTGAYGRSYSDQSQASVRKNGRRAPYASDWGGEPKPVGGALLSVSIVRNAAHSGGRQKVITVTQ